MCHEIEKGENRHSSSFMCLLRRGLPSPTGTYTHAQRPDTKSAAAFSAAPALQHRLCKCPQQRDGAQPFSEDRGVWSCPPPYKPELFHFSSFTRLASKLQEGCIGPALFRSCPLQCLDVGRYTSWAQGLRNAILYSGEAAGHWNFYFVAEKAT